jgi:hypothetical protein
MVKPISPAPSSAACNGAAPPSICLTMFSTMTNRLKALRALFRWAVEKDEAPHDPTIGVKANA